MEKEKQIEEMAKIIRETTFIRGFEYSAAAGIFAAGYGKVKEAVKDFAERVKAKIEADKYTPEIVKEYYEQEAKECEYYNWGLNHAQIIIDFFVKEVCGD